MRIPVVEWSRGRSRALRALGAFTLYDEGLLFWHRMTAVQHSV